MNKRAIALFLGSMLAWIFFTYQLWQWRATRVSAIYGISLFEAKESTKNYAAIALIAGGVLIFFLVGKEIKKQEKS